MAIVSVRHDQLQVLEFCLEFCLRSGPTITANLACAALDRRSVPMYKTLLAAGLDVNADFRHSGDALTRAVFKDDLEMTTLALSARVDLHSDRL